MNSVETINSVESKCFLDTSCYRSSINTRGNDIAESVCFTSHKANDYKGNIFFTEAHFNGKMVEEYQFSLTLYLIWLLKTLRARDSYH